MQISVYEWLFVTCCSFLAGLASMAIAVRDGKYRDLSHLCSIGIVGCVVGFGVIGGIGHAGGGIFGNELLLLLCSAGAGLGGRTVERAIRTKTATLLGVNTDNDLDGADPDRLRDSSRNSDTQ